MERARTLDVEPRLLVPSCKGGKPEGGVYSFIACSQDLESILRRRYGRPGLCLKVFRAEAKLLSEFYWGRSGNLLTDTAKAQNLFAWHGFAPRVYDIVLVNGVNWAQVTDYVVDDGGSWDRGAAHDLLKRYRVGSRGGDWNESNFIGSQMVDWQYHYLGEPYLKYLVKRCWDGAAWGSKKEPYQSMDGLSVIGQRDTEHRMQAMVWDDHDWEGKSVLDLGCNLGVFCREADSRLAKRVVGVDKPHVAQLAYELSNWFGYWNIDFLGLNLPAQKDEIVGVGQFDVVLCLSCKQVKPVPWAFDLCGDVLYFEGHVPDREHTWRPTLEEHFARVEFLGMTTDHGPRPLFRCWR